MYKDVAEYGHDISWCKVAKGHYTDPDTQPGKFIAHNPMDLLCIDFTTLDALKNGKEDVLVLTNALSKFSQAFVMPNQKAIYIAKLLMDKSFYVYGIPAHRHSDKSYSFENGILEHLYTMYNIK